MKLTTKITSSPEQKTITFIRDKDGQTLPLIENFYAFCGEGKLMGVKCKHCGAILCPPRPMCPKCLADTMEWIELEKRGSLLTYTVIHFPPSQFQALAPYVVGIVKLAQGPQLSGMVKNVKQADLQIGMAIEVDFETTLPKEWPRWSRYFFKLQNKNAH